MDVADTAVPVDDRMIDALLDPASAPEALASAVDALVQAGDPVEMLQVRRRLASALAGRAGRELERSDPARFEAAANHLDVMAHAARTTSVDQVLESFGGKPRLALEHLAGAPEEGLRQSDLERLLGIDPTYTSKIVRRLAERDLVLRWSEGRNRRVVLTAGGRIALGLPAVAPAAAVAAEPDMQQVYELVPTQHTAARQRMGPYQSTGNRFAQCWSSRIPSFPAGTA